MLELFTYILHIYSIHLFMMFSSNPLFSSSRVLIPFIRWLLCQQKTSYFQSFFSSWHYFHHLKLNLMLITMTKHVHNWKKSFQRRFSMLLCMTQKSPTSYLEDVLPWLFHKGMISQSFFLRHTHARAHTMFMLVKYWSG